METVYSIVSTIAQQSPTLTRRTPTAMAWETLATVALRLQARWPSTDARNRLGVLWISQLAKPATGTRTVCHWLLWQSQYSRSLECVATEAGPDENALLEVSAVAAWGDQGKRAEVPCLGEASPFDSTLQSQMAREKPVTERASVATTPGEWRHACGSVLVARRPDSTRKE